MVQSSKIKNQRPFFMKYIGYREEDFSTPWAKYFNENMPAIQPQVTEGLNKSPFAAGKLPPLEEACAMSNEGYAEVETGYAFQPDGSLNIAILTKMPRVKPEMWDWWFGWHGSHDNRYKLWHPKAHKSAKWQDGKENLTEYVGRTSMIQEYIGRNLAKASIQFVSPSELGFCMANDVSKEVVIGARIGLTNIPLDFGWLLHQVRATGDGAEMRSRFWMGGRHIGFRLNGKPPKLLAKMLQKVVPWPEQRAKDLLIHCTEEMNHLAQFLPEIYTEFARE
jgi:hypothetical protein